MPTIAAATDTNFRGIENGTSGYLVNSDEEWAKKLVLLIENPTLRKKIGMAGRLKKEEFFFSRCKQA